MKLQDLVNIFVFLWLNHFIKSLEHEKSFIVQDGFANINTIDIYKNSLLISNSNDVVQRDLDTGEIPRTFRAHENVIYSFVVTKDSRLITSAYDDMIILWSLDTGSILKRIWLRSSEVQIKSIFFENEKLIIGGLDGQIRQLDLVSGRLLKSIGVDGTVFNVIGEGEAIYAATSRAPFVAKISIVYATPVTLYRGHTNSAFSIFLYEDLIISGSADSSVLCWNENSGDLVRSFLAHTQTVLAVAVYDGDLFSAGLDNALIKWNIRNGQITKTFPYFHKIPVLTFAYLPQRLFTGSYDTTVVKWDSISAEPLFQYKGTVKKLRAVVSWRNLVVSGGDNVQVQIWDSSIDSFDAFLISLTEVIAINCLKVYEDFLYVGTNDNILRQWDLANFNLTRTFQSPASGIYSIASDQAFVYAGNYDNRIYQWNVSSGALTTFFQGHTRYVDSLVLSAETLYSGSSDRSMRSWDVKTQESVQSFQTLYEIYAILITEDLIVACTVDGLEMFSISSGQKAIFSPELIICTSIVSDGDKAFTGQSDATVRVRDLYFFNIVETYRGHVDYVSSLCLDESLILYSAAFDGSIKKWNRAARRVAFSFEDRNNSVTALSAFGYQLFVGLRKGTVVVYNIENSVATHSIELHSRGVTSMFFDGSIYSSALDGKLSKLSIGNEMETTTLYTSERKPIRSFAFNELYFVLIEGDTNIMLLQRKDSIANPRITTGKTPLVCVAVTKSVIIAGARSGVIYSWDIESLELSFELKGHLGQVNHLLVVDRFLYSASNDKSIIEWYLDQRILVRVFERRSSTVLGHLGLVNQIAYCFGTLFSAGADLSVRRWNILTGRHEDVYFGFSKPVTSVLCHNSSVFAGSDDFSVLMFKPTLTEQELSFESSRSTTRITNSQIQRIVLRKTYVESSGSLSGPMIFLVAVLPMLLISAGVIWFILYKRSESKKELHSDNTGFTMEPAQTTIDLKTVINTVVGISKHAAYIIENSVLAKIKRLTAGGGGEVFLAKIMDASLRKKFGEVVIQKVVFTNSTLMEEAFYQEVGIMILLNSFPHFCTILGYTEKPLSIILKYYSDGSLHEWIHKIQMTKSLVLKIVKEISEALNTMHSHYLAHCDIKPQNVLVQVDNGIPSCFLTDFGITQVLSDRIVATKTFNVINIRGLSAHYSAPESFRNFRAKNYNGVHFMKYDIYSLACLAFEVLLQKGPWD